MDNFQFKHSTKIVFGPGALNSIGKEAKSLGGRILVVSAGGFLSKGNLKERIVKIFENENLKIELFEGIAGEPKISEINQGSAFAQEKRSEVIIGLGGGSAIDAAKAIAACAASRQRIEKLLDDKNISLSVLPVIAVPTTAGTGSELTKGAIISDSEEKIKRALRSEEIIPKIAIVDPELTLSLPPGLTALTGFDALAHALETLISKKANLFTQALSQQALATIFQNLPLAVKDGNNLAARTKMSFASMIMGYNLTYATTCLPHRIQYAVGTISGMSHALGVAALYPAWLKMAEDVTTDKKILSDVRNLMKALEINVRLGDFGIKKEDIKSISDKVMGTLDQDPVYRDEGTVINILENSL